GPKDKSKEGDRQLGVPRGTGQGPQRHRRQAVRLGEGRHHRAAVLGRARLRLHRQRRRDPVLDQRPSGPRGARLLPRRALIGGLLTAAILVIAGWTFLNAAVAWAYIAAFVAFEFWLLRALAIGKGPVAAGEAPYWFSAEEAELVGRYRFYFTWPQRAKAASSVLAAIGLTALLLAPWLTYKHAFLQAVVIGVNLFAVA